MLDAVNKKPRLLTGGAYKVNGKKLPGLAVRSKTYQGNEAFLLLLPES